MTDSIPSPIKITKGYAYLIGLFFTLLLYFIGQALFFINTVKVKGRICDAQYERLSKYGEERIFYVCFTTKNWESIKTTAGSNLKYYPNDTVNVIYKVNAPQKVRLDNFTSLWLLPSMLYSIPFVIIMAVISGAYYKTRYIVISRKPFKARFSNS